MVLSFILIRSSYIQLLIWQLPVLICREMRYIYYTRLFYSLPTLSILFTNKETAPHTWLSIFLVSLSSFSNEVGFIGS